MNANDIASRALHRPLIISPHLDDAVFSCGALISAADEATVVTVFAGVPPNAEERATEWDTACGFVNAREAIERRRGEDKQAVAALGARPVWLDFCDSQYGQSYELATIARKLLEVIQHCNPDAVLVPAGLFHSDHELAHRAALLARRDRPQSLWLMYEDLLYRGVDGLLQRRLAALLDERVTATPLALDTYNGMPAKLNAAQCYLSQLKGLNTPGRPGYADMQMPERYWRLASTQERGQ